jgi:hypothetical protein
MRNMGKPLQKNVMGTARRESYDPGYVLEVVGSTAASRTAEESAGRSHHPCVNQWEKLVVYSQDGRLEIDVVPGPAPSFTVLWRQPRRIRSISTCT